MLIILLPLAVCVLGALVHFGSKGDAKILGTYAFAVGLLALLLQVGPLVVRLGR